MGSIKFYGIVEDFEKVASDELNQVIIPENAHIKDDYIEFDLKSWLIFTLPLIIIIMTIVIIKQVKSGFLNENIRNEIQENNIKKYNLNTNKKKIKFAIRNFLTVLISFSIVMLFISIIHEYLHAIVSVLFGYDTNIVLGFPMGGSTWVIEDMTKIQVVLFGLMPCLILGIIPAIIVVIIKTNKKNYLISWIVGLFSCIMIFSCGYDIVNVYNVSTMNAPNNAYVGMTDEGYYWYIKE